MPPRNLPGGAARYALMVSMQIAFKAAKNSCRNFPVAENLWGLTFAAARPDQAGVTDRRQALSPLS